MSSFTSNISTKTQPGPSALAMIARLFIAPCPHLYSSHAKYVMQNRIDSCQQLIFVREPKTNSFSITHQLQKQVTIISTRTQTNKKTGVRYRISKQNRVNQMHVNRNVPILIENTFRNTPLYFHIASTHGSLCESKDAKRYGFHTLHKRLSALWMET